MAFEDYYALLEIDRDATEDEIRKAFRSKVLKLHPDRNPGDLIAEENFKRVLAAYEILSDAQKRAEHDSRAGAFEEVSAISQKQRRDAQALGSPARPRPARRSFQQEVAFYTGEFREADIVRGILMGTAAASIWSLSGPGQSVIERLTSFCLAAALPCGGGWLACLLATFFRDLGIEISSDPPAWLEYLMASVPILSAAGGAFFSLRAGRFLGSPLPSEGIFPSALAAGVACSVGSGIGRAFTSVAHKLSSKLFGVLVGASLSLVIGGVLGAFLTTIGLNNPFDPAFSDLLAIAIVGGSCGGALASIPGSWIPAKTPETQVNDETFARFR